MKERDSFYGYGGFYPMPNQVGGMIYPNYSNDSSYNINSYNDFSNRIERLERQIKRLDQRLTRLETPYANDNNNSNNEPDSNMYMM